MTDLGPQFDVPAVDDPPVAAPEQPTWKTLQKHHRVNSEPDDYQRSRNEHEYHRARLGR